MEIFSLVSILKAFQAAILVWNYIGIIIAIDRELFVCITGFTSSSFCGSQGCHKIKEIVLLLNFSYKI